MTEPRLSKNAASKDALTPGDRVFGSDFDHTRLLTRRLPAWFLSLILHAVFFILLMMLVRVTQRGGAMEPARGASIVLTQDVEGQAQYFSDAESSSDSAASDARQDVQGALPDQQQLPLDLAGMLPEKQQQAAGDQVASSLPSASQMALGTPVRRGQIDGNQARTSIFGAEGTGNKFVYVFDRSASMSGYQGRPLAAAKQELVASLQDLDQLQQFQILFYNDSRRPTVFNPQHPQPPRMLFGDARTRRMAQGFVKGIVAAGGTEHMLALRLALGMQPDVIFFLTDADEPQLTTAELAEIARVNARVGATIHTIEFGAGPRQGGISFLTRLARQNGGNYVYVDVTRLPR